MASDHAKLTSTGNPLEGVDTTLTLKLPLSILIQIAEISYRPVSSTLFIEYSIAPNFRETTGGIRVTRPGRFPTIPPVLVPQATSPDTSKATAPTVSPGELAKMNPTGASV